MKKILLVFALFLSFNLSFGAFTVTEPAMKPVAETKAKNERVMMEMISKMSVKDYEILTGKKINFAERFAFKITKKRLQKKLAMADDTSTGFNIGGFALGFFLGLIGVLIAYVFIKDDNLRKWSWIGLGAALVIALIIIAA